MSNIPGLVRLWTKKSMAPCACVDETKTTERERGRGTAKHSLSVCLSVGKWQVNTSLSLCCLQCVLFSCKLRVCHLWPLVYRVSGKPSDVISWDRDYLYPILLVLFASPQAELLLPFLQLYSCWDEICLFSILQSSANISLLNDCHRNRTSNHLLIIGDLNCLSIIVRSFLIVSSYTTEYSCWN